MRAHANNERRADTQWSDAENETLEELATEHPTRDDLARLFPGRTLAAVKQKLYHTRRELGIEKRRQRPPVLDTAPTMLDPDDPGVIDLWLPAWMTKAAESNQQFLAALAQAA